MLGLALRDFRHEWRLSACYVLALAAVLAPLLVLFGLKWGVIKTMSDRLIENPLNRQIQPAASGRYGAQWFAAMRARPDVAFVLPQTRLIASTIYLSNPENRDVAPVTAELFPTAPGDPLLARVGALPTALEEVVLSATAAEKLKAGPGAQVRGALTRIRRNEMEGETIALKVVAVAPLSAFGRDAAYVTPALLSAVEAFRDGRAVPALGWTGDAPRDTAEVFAGFRLYATSIYDVEGLRAHLTAQGIDVRTRAAEIETVVSLDRNLSAVFWIVASIGIVGFLLSLSSSLWGNVNRKRRELGVLRLVGYSTFQVALFPVYQAAAIAGFGVALAIVVYALAERGINRFFSQSLEAGEMVCQLAPQHIAAACLATLTTAILAACYPGSQAARIEPSEALREH